MTEFTTVTDCLVFKFDEFCIDTQNIDTTVYVLYDKQKHSYVVRGQRRCTKKHQKCTYSFECEFANDLVDFLQYIICPGSMVNETLYNYDNLPYSSNNLTFDYLKEQDHSDYEISGYDGQTLARKKMLKKLRMLRNVSNSY